MDVRSQRKAAYVTEIKTTTQALFEECGGVFSAGKKKAR
jgi:hypothetical protein